MKIYTRLEIDIETGQILTEESQDYSGPVALCGGGGSTTVKTSKEEKALLNTQNQILQQQMNLSTQANQLSDKLLPFTLESMNLKMDADGNLSKIAEKTTDEILAEKNLALMGYSSTGQRLTDEQMQGYMTDDEKMQSQVTKLANERLLKAYKGEVELSPALESELGSQEKNLRESLSRKLGSGWELSTPGQNALAKFQQSANMIREEARQGIISSSEGISAARENAQGSNMDQNSSVAAMLKAMRQGNMSAFMGAPTGIYGSGNDRSALDTASTMASQYASQRANKQNVNNMNATNRANTTNSAIGAAGSAAAAAAAAY